MEHLLHTSHCRLSHLISQAYKIILIHVCSFAGEEMEKHLEQYAHVSVLLNLSFRRGRALPVLSITVLPAPKSIPGPRQALFRAHALSTANIYKNTTNKGTWSHLPLGLLHNSPVYTQQYLWVCSRSRHRRSCSSNVIEPN